MVGISWWISDEFWEKMAPLIPVHNTNHPLGTHRKHVDNRDAMDACMTKAPLSGKNRLQSHGQRETVRKARLGCCNSKHARYLAADTLDALLDGLTGA